MSQTGVLEPQQFSGTLSINVLRDWILDNKLTEDDTVLLHPYTFDDLVLEYRETYSAPMPIPYFLLGVLIEESTQLPVAQDQLVVIKNDTRPGRLTAATSLLPVFDDGRLIYRCSYCGSVVNSGGSLLDTVEKEVLMGWLGNRRTNKLVRTVAGACCPGGKVASGEKHY